MVTEFATALFHFKTLHPDDQVALLKCNIPLYLQYILARYFCAKTGIEQLSWILEGQLSTLMHDDSGFLRRIGLHEFNLSAGLFASADMSELYYRYSYNIEMFYQFPQACNGLVANLLLYRTNENLLASLKEPEKVLRLHDDARRLVRLGLEHLDARCNLNPSLGPLVHSLDVMRNVFDNCQVDTEEKGILARYLPRPLMLNYTDTEEKWLQDRFRSYQEQFKLVEPPAGLLRESVQMLFGKEVSKSFVPLWMNLFTERIRRVLRIHSEYLSLSNYDQAALLNKNIPVAMALNSARMSLCRTGKDQVRQSSSFYVLQNESSILRIYFPLHIFNASIN
jgi:hypothetical protein